MATTDTAAEPRFIPQELPYAYDALAPAISEETMHYHHDKHLSLIHISSWPRWS